MDTNEILRRYIDGEEGRVVFRCRSEEEVTKLFRTVRDIVSPCYYGYLDLKQRVYGSRGYENEVCYRFERDGGKFDWGHDHTSYYIRSGRKIIDVSDILIQQDFGEFETNDIGMNGLLFGG